MEWDMRRIGRKSVRVTFCCFALLSLSRCSQTATGTYTGTESVTFSNSPITLSPTSITISLTATNNDTLVGSYQSTFGSGTLSGRPSGELSLPFTLVQNYPGITPITVN